MTTTVTMLQTRRGEDGNPWLVGQSYEATDGFAAVLITANFATGVLPKRRNMVALYGATDPVSGEVVGLWLPDGTVLYFGGVLAQQNADVVAPADTNKNVLFTCVIPANTLRANDALRITHNWECTNNANAKTLVFDWNGGASASFSTGALANSASQRGIWTLSNRNSLAAQVADASLGFIGAGTTSPTSTIDFSVSQTLTIALTKATGADVVTQKRVLVELLRGV